MSLELESADYPSKRAGYSAVAVMTLAQVFALMDESKLGIDMALTGAIVLPTAALLFKIALPRYRDAYQKISII